MTDQPEVPVWFPEPPAVDDTFGRRGESLISWIGRATVPRARETRRFFNENLAFLPEDFQRYLHHTLNQEQQFQSTLFELVVARTLQILGATIEAEPESAAGTRIDFEARFPDGALSVEAIAPVFMGHLGDTMRDRNPLLDIIQDLVPEGWTAWVSEVPGIGPADSKRDFKTAVETMLRDIPPPTDDAGMRTYSREIDAGTITIELYPKRTEGSSIGVEPSLTWLGSDGVERIRHAVKVKRRQARNAELPTLLAIGVPAGIARTDLEDFDRALYGERIVIMGMNRQIVAEEFRTTGIFAQDRQKPSTYAGVLAFPLVAVNRVDDPVLYHHPRFDGTLPGSLLTLEQHSLRRYPPSIVVQPAQRDDLLADLHIVRCHKPRRDMGLSHNLDDAT